jgi:hypothetical protein
MLAGLFAAAVASALPLPLRGQKFGTIMKIAANIFAQYRLRAKCLKTSGRRRMDLPTDNSFAGGLL